MKDKFKPSLQIKCSGTTSQIDRNRTDRVPRIVNGRTHGEAVEIDSASKCHLIQSISSLSSSRQGCFTPEDNETRRDGTEHVFKLAGLDRRVQLI